MRNKKTKRVSCARGGFTLIELLTVMAVLAILMGIFFPMVRGGVSRARTAHGASNLRQIGTIMTSYVEDHNGLLPILLDYQRYYAPPETAFWQNLLRKHAGLPAGKGGTWLPSIFYDPSVKTGRQHLWGCFGGNSAIMLFDSQCRTVFKHAQGTPINRIGETSRKVVACSAGTPDGSGNYDSSWQFNGPEWVNAGLKSKTRPVARNAGRALSLFADGHVDALDIEAMDKPQRERLFLPDEPFI